MLLDYINKENDIKKLSEDEWPVLAQEIRDFLIEKISVTGGHLGSNLGAVELTMALHLMLDLPKDKIVWDVGHQAYTHKLLTGRKEGFDTLRKYGGMAGFPKTKESPCDAFNTGHSSTSVSAGMGLVKAAQLKGEDSTVVSVIGDGSLTGGMAYEALNNASKLDRNFIIILNDNNMSISENVGGVSRYLDSIRTAESYRDLKTSVMKHMQDMPGGGELVRGIQKAKTSLKTLFVPGMFFEDMGITYLGPVDGHDVKSICYALQDAKKVKGAVLIHVITKKGKGYIPAEKHPSRFHGTEAFEIGTGLPSNPKTKSNYTDVFSTVMVKLGERNPKVCAITAAMPDGTGLKRFRNAYPDRFFDVGIAEEHAVTFAAGLAAGGMIPIVAIYSSFLQRAYDQIVHDVCIQNLHVIFAIDRAGIVGSDGETHQGIFDLSYLSSIPNMHILAPKNKWELSDMLKFAVEFDGPIAIRYPRGEAYDGLEQFRNPIEMGVSELLTLESTVAIMAVGSMVPIAMAARDILHSKGVDCTVVNARFVKPIDETMIMNLSKGHSIIATLEENVLNGGFGEKVRNFADAKGISSKIVTIGLPDAFLEHGSVDILQKASGIDAESVADRICDMLWIK